MDCEVVGGEDKLVSSTAFREGFEQLSIEDSAQGLAPCRRRPWKSLTEVTRLNHRFVGGDGECSRFPSGESSRHPKSFDSGNEYLCSDEVRVTQLRQFLQVGVQSGEYVCAPCDDAVICQRIRGFKVVVVPFLNCLFLFRRRELLFAGPRLIPCGCVVAVS